MIFKILRITSGIFIGYIFMVFGMLLFIGDFFEISTSTGLGIFLSFILIGFGVFLIIKAVTE